MVQLIKKIFRGIAFVFRSIKGDTANEKWSLLLVKENGEIISLDSFKELVVTLAVIMVITLTTAIGAYVLYHNEKGKNDILNENLKTAQHKISALQDDKDVLMVRLVRAESKATDKPSDSSSLNEPSSDTQVNERFAEATPVSEGDTEKAISPDLNHTGKRNTAVETTEVVDIQKFNVSYDTKGDMLSVEFILKKINATTNKVSGRAFVVLKSDSSEIDPLVIPAATLRSGIPSQIKRGQYFSIAHLKWMHFKKKFPPPLKSFNLATVLVFSAEEKLLLEKDITIGDKS